MKLFYKIGIFALLLSGCSQKDPVNNIVNEHVQLVDEVLDYANNNMEDSQDMQYMKLALKDCKTGLISANETHKTVLATCEARTNYWKMATLWVGTLLIVVLIYTFRGFIRKILHL